MLTWSDLTQEQKCVLVNAAKSALLQDVLRSWELDSDIDALTAHIPRLANAIVELVRAGLVEVYHSSSVKVETSLALLDEVPAIVSDPANWWTDDGPASFVELATTTWADATFRSRGNEDLFSFRHHDPLTST